MKKYLIIIIILLSAHVCVAQETISISSLRSKTYISTPHKENLSGIWVASDQKYSVSIVFEKKHVKKGRAGLDFYYDGIRMSFEKVEKGEKNVSHHFQGTPIALLTVDGVNYSGGYQDPITKNYVNVKLFIKDRALKMTSIVNSQISNGQLSDGISFPYELSFIKKAG